MTVTMTRPRTAPQTDRIMLVSDPSPGTVVELNPGAQLGLRFHKGLGASRWHIAELPAYLLPLSQDGHEFQFLVFGCTGSSGVLRMERRHPEREFVHEVCELRIVPVSDDRARTSGSASQRTA